mmetsp:Transcript_37335/g.81326  ORF Transcript_37335/g.81326 Transcript_37335/m.81326 type:complete len:237 (+) Transcript_37335:404-1114(+)
MYDRLGSRVTANAPRPFPSSACFTSICARVSTGGPSEGTPTKMCTSPESVAALNSESNIRIPVTRAPIPAPMLTKSTSLDCTSTPTRAATALSPNNPAQQRRRLKRREPRPSAGSHKYNVKPPDETVRNVSPSITKSGMYAVSFNLVSSAARSRGSVFRRSCRCRFLFILVLLYEKVGGPSEHLMDRLWAWRDHLGRICCTTASRPLTWSAACGRILRTPFEHIAWLRVQELLLVL